MNYLFDKCVLDFAATRAAPRSPYSTYRASDLRSAAVPAAQPGSCGQSGRAHRGGLEGTDRLGINPEQQNRHGAHSNRRRRQAAAIGQDVLSQRRSLRGRCARDPRWRRWTDRAARHLRRQAFDCGPSLRKPRRRRDACLFRERRRRRYHHGSFPRLGLFL
jgi:hypothetical protein